MDLAWIDLRTGQAAAAHDRLSPIRESFTAKGFGLLASISLELWTTDIEALIAGGHVDQAQFIVDELLGRAHKTENPNAIAIAERCKGLVFGARGQIPAAIDAMRLALTEHERRPLAPEIARTLLELGTLQRRAKQKSAAKQTLDQALAMLIRMDSRIWQERARDEIARIGLRRPSVSEGLTPAQERVVELVASGMSNREIASTLYMSVRTVESHLTKAYRELGVKSRSQLSAAMARRHATKAPP
jgi:DNA-binding CsgD family transcriptional regulator